MIDLTPANLAIVEGILDEHVPGCEVRAFGSRAKWTARDASDLDLAVVGDGPLPDGVVYRLKEAFEESRLPMRVDVLDWHTISDTFRDLITPDCVVMREAATAPGWPMARLGDLAEITKGLSYKSEFLNEDGPDLLGLGQFVPGGGVKLDGGRTYSGQYRDKDVTRPGDVLIAMTDLTQRGDVLGSPLMVPATVGDFCLYTLDAGKLKHDASLDARFLYYMLKSPDFRGFAAAHATGTTVRRVRPDDVLAYEFPLPPLEEQRAIAGVLGALDDRIEASRRMSATLEEMARALFRSWFVEFEPVRAKAEGRPSGLPPALDALFPSTLAPSALGPIPSGWAVRPAGEAMTVHGGSTPSTKEPAYWSGDHSFATPKDLSTLREPILASTARGLTDAGIARIRSGLLPPGTVLLSSRAPIGYLAITRTPTAINQGIIAMACDGPVGPEYALHWTRSNMHAVEARASGTTFAEISKSSFRELPFLVPPGAVHDAWQGLVAPMYDLVAWNARQSCALAAQREALLPRLVSGSVRVSDRVRE